jgi:hypothetical protein
MTHQTPGCAETAKNDRKCFCSHFKLTNFAPSHYRILCKTKIFGHRFSLIYTDLKVFFHKNVSIKYKNQRKSVKICVQLKYVSGSEIQTIKTAPIMQMFSVDIQRMACEQSHFILYLSCHRKRQNDMLRIDHIAKLRNSAGRFVATEL